MAHTCSYWLDFANDKVFCSKLCGKDQSPIESIEKIGPEWTLQITNSLLPQYKGKIYLVRYRGEYLCSITGYTHGVLHLLDFAKPYLFDNFRQAVSSCFGVNYIQLQKEVV